MQGRYIINSLFNHKDSKWWGALKDRGLQLRHKTEAVQTKCGHSAEYIDMAETNIGIDWTDRRDRCTDLKTWKKETHQDRINTITNSRISFHVEEPHENNNKLHKNRKYNI